MTRLHDAAGNAGCGQAIGAEGFAQGTVALANETVERELHQAVGPCRPLAVAADFRPGQAGFEQMHVRIRFDVTAAVFGGTEGTVGSAEPVLDGGAQRDGATFEEQPLIERDRGGGIA